MEKPDPKKLDKLHRQLQNDCVGYLAPPCYECGSFPDGMNKINHYKGCPRRK